MNSEVLANFFLYTSLDKDSEATERLKQLRMEGVRKVNDWESKAHLKEEMKNLGFYNYRKAIYD